MLLCCEIEPQYPPLPLWMGVSRCGARGPSSQSSRRLRLASLRVVFALCTAFMRFLKSNCWVLR